MLHLILCVFVSFWFFEFDHQYKCVIVSTAEFNETFTNVFVTCHLAEVIYMLKT